MSKEAMQQAMEALKESIDVPCYGGHPKQEAAYHALQEASAKQPVQQEPVAWMTKTGSVWKTKDDETDEPLYTSPPPQRTWVGLTDDELADFWFKQSLDWMEFARVIEDALRSKNT